MKGNLSRLVREEKGVTALETAIILIAFVVVASVFAFTILSSGTTSTQKSKEAIAAGLAQVQGTMEVRGSVIALGASGVITEVHVSLANVAGGEPVDLTTGANKVVVIDYRDATQRAADLATWSVTWRGNSDGDDLLEERELAEITIPLTPTVTLGANTSFVIEIKPPKGGVISLERTTPAMIDMVMDLE